MQRRRIDTAPSAASASSIHHGGAAPGATVGLTAALLGVARAASAIRASEALTIGDRAEERRREGAAVVPAEERAEPPRR